MTMPVSPARPVFRWGVNGAGADIGGDGYSRQFVILEEMNDHAFSDHLIRLESRISGGKVIVRERRAAKPVQQLQK
jgi:hypothetical protein